MFSRYQAVANRFTYQVGNVVTGDARAGEAFFQLNCSGCHSRDKDLAHVAAKWDPPTLQRKFLYPADSLDSVAATATLTLPSGEILRGRLTFQDDFRVILLINGKDRVIDFDDGTDYHLAIENPLAGHEACCEILRRRHAQYSRLPGDDAVKLYWALLLVACCQRRFAKVPSLTTGPAITATLPAAFQQRDTNQRRECCAPRSRMAVQDQHGIEPRIFGGVIKSTPVASNGVLYFTVPDHCWAISALSGKQLWHFTWPSQGGIHIGNRGVAVYKDSVYLATPDNHLVALDARTGKLRWAVEIADTKLQYFSTAAPLIIGNHLIIGVGGDSLDFLDIWSRETRRPAQYSGAGTASRAQERRARKLGRTALAWRTAGECLGCREPLIPN